VSQDGHTGTLLMHEIGHTLLTTVCGVVLSAKLYLLCRVRLALERRVQEITFLAISTQIDGLGDLAVGDTRRGLAFVESVSQVGVLSRVQRNNRICKSVEI
jgi:hypothetical protein